MTKNIGKSIRTRLLNLSREERVVSFDPSSLDLESIATDKKYPGTCVKVIAHLDTIVQQISIDIGFGDVVTPYPLSLDYPLLLSDVPSVELYAYSLETLIAEKFHTMVDRDESNSRMKDFFDVYQLFTNHEIDRQLLAEAIASTFRNRNTIYKESLMLFTDTFSSDPIRNNLWKSFLKKIRWKEPIPFPVVMQCIKENLQEFWTKDL